MAFLSGRKAILTVNEHDLSGFFRDSSANDEVTADETTTYGRDRKTYIDGLADGTISADGLFDGAVGAADERLRALKQASPSPIVARAVAPLIGAGCQFGRAIDTSYEVSSPVDGVVETSAEFQISGGLAFGSLLTDGLQAYATATLTGASIDGGVASTGGGRAMYALTASGGAVLVKVQHSVNNSTWADLLTFTAAGAGVEQADLASVAGTVNRYVRTLVSGGASTILVAFARG